MSWINRNSHFFRIFLHSFFPVFVALTFFTTAGHEAAATTISVGVSAFIIPPETRVAVEDCLQGVGQNCDLVIVRVGAQTVCDAKAMCDLRGGETLSFRAYQAQFVAQQPL